MSDWINTTIGEQATLQRGIDITKAKQRDGDLIPFLVRDSVCANFAHTAEDGKTYQTRYFNLDVIISVGYRVKSQRGMCVYARFKCF